MNIYNLALYLHIITISLFTLLIAVKTWYLVTGQIETMEKVKKATQKPEALDILIGIITGIYLITVADAVPGRIWVKIGLVAIAIPLGVAAFRYHKRIFGPVTLLILLYIILLSLLDSLTIF